MRSGVIAQKVGMTRIFTDAGEHIPVTVLKLDKCQVLGHRTNDKNGYTAMQLGSGMRKPSRLTKADRQNFAVAKVEPKRKLAEFRVSPDREWRQAMQRLDTGVNRLLWGVGGSALLLAGVDLFMMLHPAAVKTLRNTIKRLTAKSGSVDVSKIADWVSAKF